MATLEKPIEIESAVEINGVTVLAFADENMHATGTDCAVEPHKHSYFELCYVEKGGALVVMDDNEYEILSGNAYLYHPNEYHCRPLEGISADFSQYSIRFRLQPSSKAQSSHIAVSQMTEALQSVHIMSCDQCEIELYAKRLAAEMRDKLLGYKSSAVALLGLLVTEIVRLAYRDEKTHYSNAFSSHVGRAARIERFFGNHYAEKIRLADLAAYINISPRQADRILRREFGMTFLEKLNEARLSAAKHKLAYGGDRVKDIAFACGFQSYGYFAASFKKYVGITPIEYRRTKQRG